mgnify:CR=1 FL=1
MTFGGWEMPLQYAGIVREHLAVRRSVGLFDVSHMGDLLVSGDDALPFLRLVLTNDISSCPVGQQKYTHLLRDDGGVIDDLIVLRLDES